MSTELDPTPNQYNDLIWLPASVEDSVYLSLELSVAGPILKAIIGQEDQGDSLGSLIISASIEGQFTLQTEDVLPSDRDPVAMIAVTYFDSNQICTNEIRSGATIALTTGTVGLITVFGGKSFTTYFLGEYNPSAILAPLMSISLYNEEGEPGLYQRIAAGLQELGKIYGGIYTKEALNTIEIQLGWIIGQQAARADVSKLIDAMEALDSISAQYHIDTSVGKEGGIMGLPEGEDDPGGWVSSKDGSIKVQITHLMSEYATEMMGPEVWDLLKWIYFQEDSHHDNYPFDEINALSHAAKALRFPSLLEGIDQGGYNHFARQFFVNYSASLAQFSVEEILQSLKDALTRISRPMAPSLN